MRLGWDEIKRRAKAFSEEWQHAHYEKGETQTFYNEFFEIFGIKRKQVAIYEQRVKLLKQKHGFIDLFWPGTLLVEQKSSNLDLDRAQGQALDYVEGIHQSDQPRWVLTCDFQRWRLLDLETGDELRFHLKDLHKHITAFDFMLGRKVSFETQASVTIKAAELMGKLHDALEDSGYTGHDLEQLLVRLLFCMFADRTGIFQPMPIFLQLLENDTKPDGSDVGRVLNDLFDVLDTPETSRQSTLQAELNAFPYVNGRLFAGRLRTPHFTAKMREQLLDACRHDWSGVSPAIFGSLFQSVMDAKERRAKGAHYTTEANILKVIGSKPIDGGYLIFDAKERADLLASEPDAEPLLRPYIGAQEFINGGMRWIAALQSVPPDTLRKLPKLMERVALVRQFREGKVPPKGKADDKKSEPGMSSKALAATPTAFHVTVIPDSPFLAIPEVSSERRDYVPLGWLEPPTIASNLVRVMMGADLFDFGVLNSRMNMAWLGHIGGRLKSDYRYSIGLVYNTFPWPDVSPAQREKVEALAQAVLDARAVYPTSSLADLYDPDRMPLDLRKAHSALDTAVDRLYRSAPFASDRDRVEHLFGRYEALVNPLERLGAAKNKRVARKASAGATNGA